MSNINITIGDAPINLTITNPVSHPAYVNEDIPFRFDGASGDTYLKYNSTTNRLELWVDGTKAQEWG